MKIGAEMKILLVAVVMVALLTGVASSQISGGTGDNANTYSDKIDSARKRAEEKRKEQMELDAKYKAALDKTKAPAVAADPWATVRPAPKRQ
jgi:F0F1-type ATP synthase membrane subunit b/b'